MVEARSQDGCDEEAHFSKSATSEAPAVFVVSTLTKNGAILATGDGGHPLITSLV
jgi:hypothetical protein